MQSTATFLRYVEVVQLLLGHSLKDTVYYQDPRNISKPNSLYRHSFIGKAINLAFFKDHASLGVAHHELFEDSDGALPATVIALVVTAVRTSPL